MATAEDRKAHQALNRCPDCGAHGAHFCTGKPERNGEAKAYSVLIGDGPPNLTAREASQAEKIPDGEMTLYFNRIQSVLHDHLPLDANRTRERFGEAIEALKNLKSGVEALRQQRDYADQAREKVQKNKAEWAALVDESEKNYAEAAAALAVEKQKNLFDRKVFIFASLVQTWLAAPVMGIRLTPCRAAWIQGQAFLVSPAVLGEMGANFNKEGSLAWQACDFCKTLSEFDQWPSWTQLK